MKKIWKYMAAAGLFMVLLLAACYIRLPDYRIYKVFSYSGLNVRETDLYVIVYKPWRIDHEVQGIVSQHNEMNGTPDKLTVWLYYSKYNLDRRKDFKANTLANHFNEKDSMGNVMALPPPKAVTVMISRGIARNANTSTAHMVKSLFLRIILTSPVQFSCQSIKAPDHSQCYNDHDQRDHRSTGPVTDGHGTLIDQGRHYHVGVASQ